MGQRSVGPGQFDEIYPAGGNRWELSQQLQRQSRRDRHRLDRRGRVQRKTDRGRRPGSTPSFWIR
jgi:hypothetical protein